MKKVMFVVMIMCLAVAVICVDAQAARNRGTQKSKGLSKGQVVAHQQETISVLNTQQWLIYLTPVNMGKKAKVITDTLIFNGGTVTTQRLSEKEFTPSNYAVNINPDGTSVLETLQRTKDNDLAAWRMDFTGNDIRGTLKVISNKGVVLENYTFKTNP